MMPQRPAARPREKPHSFWAPAAAVVALALPAALALAARQVFLFASLGPTAVMLAHEPRHRGSRIYSVVVGHSVGLGAAFLSVWLLGLSHTPSVFVLHTVSAARAGAALLSLGGAAAIELALRAQHPPAASTTLLAALGSFHPTWHDTGLVVGGVAAVAVAGEVVRQLRLRWQLGIEAGPPRPPQS